MTEKKKGRPQGSKTADRQPVEIFVDPCRRCGWSTKPSDFQKTHEAEASGENEKGKYCRFYIWTADCGNCGAKLQVRSYDYYEVKEPAKA